MSQLVAEVITAVIYYGTMARVNLAWARERLRARKGD